MLKKQNRLGRVTRSKEDKFFSFPLFDLRVHANGEESTKFTFIVSKKIDKRAVVRNRTKRVLRSAAEDVIKDFATGKEVVIIAKKALIPEQKTEVSGILKKLF